MSETKHSPEPWRFENIPGRKGAGAVRDVGDFVVARTLPEAMPGDARRIVACVNACAGIPTEALEAGALAEALDQFEEVASETTETCCPTCAASYAALRALGRLP
jgi:hypothetical protein